MITFKIYDELYQFGKILGISKNRMAFLTDIAKNSIEQTDDLSIAFVCQSLYQFCLTEQEKLYLTAKVSAFSTLSLKQLSFWSKLILNIKRWL